MIKSQLNLVKKRCKVLPNSDNHSTRWRCKISSPIDLSVFYLEPLDYKMGTQSTGHLDNHVRLISCLFLINETETEGAYWKSGAEPIIPWNNYIFKTVTTNRNRSKPEFIITHDPVMLIIQTHSSFQKSKFRLGFWIARRVHFRSTYFGTFFILQKVDLK